MEDFLRRKGSVEDSDEPPMDDLEPELIEKEEKPSIVKATKSQHMRKHRTEVETADLHDDEQKGTTIYIDNLPNHPDDIREMIEEVKLRIHQCEQKWFEME